MQFGERFMRKVLDMTAAPSALVATSMAANAADVTARPAPYAPPPPVYAPPPFTWTGFYLGGNIGAAWAHRDVTDTFFLGDFGGGNNNNGVFIGGGQLGYNWQVGYAVLGIEWDIDGAANNNNTGTVFVPGAGTIQVTSNNRWITTLAAPVAAIALVVLFLWLAIRLLRRPLRGVRPSTREKEKI